MQDYRIIKHPYDGTEENNLLQGNVKIITLVSFKRCYYKLTNVFLKYSSDIRVYNLDVDVNLDLKFSKLSKIKMNLLWG